MKLDTCNKLADYIIERAMYHRGVAQTSATMYAESDDKEDQNTFKRASYMEKELRELHSVVCQYLHTIEDELM